MITIGIFAYDPYFPEPQMFVPILKALRHPKKYLFNSWRHKLGIRIKTPARTLYLIPLGYKITKTYYGYTNTIKPKPDKLLPPNWLSMSPDQLHKACR